MVTDFQKLKIFKEYFCGIPKDLIIKCPGRHETKNVTYIQPLCAFSCPAYSDELHELFYHKSEEWWKTVEKNKKEKERFLNTSENAFI